MIVWAAALITLAAFFYTLFVRRQDVPEPLPVSPVQHLEDRKQAIYENLRDLQFEYRLGKLSDSDYAATKQALQRELAGVLLEMEETLKRVGVAAIAALAAKPAAMPKAKSARTTCPHCGAAFPQALKFCGECGRPIA